jgi:Kef-type K+ transport system membrane component KefB
MVYGLLTRLAAIVILVIVISVLIGAGIAGTLCFTYSELLLRGFDRYASLGIVAGIMALLLLCLCIAAGICWRRFRRLSRHMLSEYAPISMRVSKVAHSFIDGLMGTGNEYDL